MREPIGHAISASSDLAVWLGREGTEELVAVDPGTLEQLPLQPPELADAVQLALANRPLVHGLQALVRAPDKGVTVARAGYLPRLSTSLLYNRNSPSSDPFFTDLRQQNSFAASLNLSWNLFAGFQTSGQVRDAELDLERRKLTLAQFEKDLMGDVYKALVTLRAQLKAAQVAAGGADEAPRLGRAVGGGGRAARPPARSAHPPGTGPA